MIKYQNTRLEPAGLREMIEPSLIKFFDIGNGYFESPLYFDIHPFHRICFFYFLNQTEWGNALVTIADEWLQNVGLLCIYGRWASKRAQELKVSIQTRMEEQGNVKNKKSTGFCKHNVNNNEKLTEQTSLINLDDVDFLL